MTWHIKLWELCQLTKVITYAANLCNSLMLHKWVDKVSIILVTEVSWLTCISYVLSRSSPWGHLLYSSWVILLKIQAENASRLTEQKLSEKINLNCIQHKTSIQLWRKNLLNSQDLYKFINSDVCLFAEICSRAQLVTISDVELIFDSILKF